MHPKLRDVRPINYKYDPGDRLLVRVGSTLDKDQMKKIIKSVHKFCGNEVRVLILNFLKVEIWRISGGRSTILVGPEILPQDNLQLGVVHLSCSKVDFEPGDLLVIRGRGLSDLQKKTLKQEVGIWAGNEVEVRCE